MRPHLPIALCLCAGLAACVETGSPAEGFSDNAMAPTGMREACLAQAERLTGVPSSAITARTPIETGGGILISLDIAGASYGCRREADGSYTVFSQFAN